MKKLLLLVLMIFASYCFASDAYVLEFGNRYIRFFRNGGQILDPNDPNEPYQITSPYDTNGLFDIQYVQSNDVMYLVEPNTWPQKLSRFNHTSWTIEDVNFVDGPFLDTNTNKNKHIVPSDTNGTITLIADFNCWDTNSVDTYWQLGQAVEANTMTKDFGEGIGYQDGCVVGGNSVNVRVYKHQEWEFSTNGTWNGTQILEKSYDNGDTWDTEYTVDSSQDNNRFESGVEEEDSALYRVRCPRSCYINTKYGVGSPRCTFTAFAFTKKSVVKIVSYVDANEVTATVIGELASTTATYKWAEGAWGVKNGFPTAITFFQQRLVLAGSKKQPNTLWISKSIEFENMDVGKAEDDDAIVYTAASTQQNPITWLSDIDTIIAGTSGGTIQVGVLNSSSPLKADNIMAKRQSTNGSESIQPVNIGESLLFVERGGRKLYDLSYNLESDGYVSSDLTILASHITDSNIVEMSLQMRPTPILWCVKNNGELIALSFQRQQKVIAWHRHPMTNGLVESVAVIPSSGEDEVWLAVHRVIDDVNVRYIEQMQPQDWGSDVNDCWFVDSGLVYDGNATAIITGLSHLIGETVSVFADGGYYQSAVVDANGAVTLTQAVSRANIGEPYTSTIQTMPIELKDSATGYTIGRMKRIYEIFVAFDKSLNCEYGYEGGTFYPVRMYESTGILTGGAQPLYTGYRTLPFAGTQSKEVSIVIRQSKPYPMSILAISPKITYGD